MLAGLPLLLSCVSAGVIPLAGRDSTSLTNAVAEGGFNQLADPFDVHSSKRDGLFTIPNDIISAIAGSVEHVLNLPNVNNTEILQDIEGSISSQLHDLGQDFQFLDPFHIFQVIEKAVGSLPSDLNNFKNTLVHDIESVVGPFFGIQPSKRDGLFTIPNDIISAIAGSVERVLHLPNVNNTEILQDIESSITKQLSDLGQDFQFLDPFHIFQVIEKAVSGLPSDINNFKNTLVHDIESVVGPFFGIQPSKRDGLFTIPNDIISAIAGSVERVLHLPNVNNTEILQDIESSITKQLSDLGQDFQFLDPFHIFQVIEKAVSGLPSDINNFKNTLVHDIESVVGPFFGIQPSKRDGLLTIPNDIISAIAGSIERVVHLPNVNNTEILQDIEGSISSQLHDLGQDFQFLDPFHIFQVIEKAVGSLPSDLNKVKNTLVHDIESVVGPFFGIQPSKRDGLLTIPNDIISAIAGSIERVVHLPNVNNTEILQDIEGSISSQLHDLGQDFQFLDPFHIFQVIEKAVGSLPSDLNNFKNTLVHDIESVVGPFFGIQPSKRDGLFTIPNDIISAIAGSVERVLHLPNVNNTEILQDIESSITKQLSDLGQDFQFLDPFHIFQVIEKAVSGLPSDINNFKNTLVHDIESVVGPFFGIQPSKRDALSSIGPDAINAISTSIDNTLSSIPFVNNTQILHDIEKSIDSQLSDLNQGLGALDQSHAFQIIQNAVSSLPSTVDQVKNGLIQSIQNAVGTLFPNLQ